MQDFGNSIANALELLQSCTKPAIYFSIMGLDCVKLYSDTEPCLSTLGKSSLYNKMGDYTSILTMGIMLSTWYVHKWNNKLTKLGDSFIP